ncbi:MAG: DUF6308 family protein [Acidimicrobiales bacterium]
MASTLQPHFGRDLIEAMGKSKAAAAAVIEHLGSPAGEFDRLIHASDPNQIEPIDLVRVSMLGEPISPVACRWLLSDDGRWLTAEALSDIPVDIELGVAHATATFRCSDLLSLFQYGAVTGHAQATRLLAAKRPAFVPIDDKPLRRALDAPKDDGWWRRWRSAMSPELSAKVAVVRDRAIEVEPAAAELPLLRVVDIAVRANAR